MATENVTAGYSFPAGSEDALLPGGAGGGGLVDVSARASDHATHAAPQMQRAVQVRWVQAGAGWLRAAQVLHARCWGALKSPPRCLRGRAVKRACVLNHAGVFRGARRAAAAAAAAGGARGGGGRGQRARLGVGPGGARPHRRAHRHAHSPLLPSLPAASLHGSCASFAGPPRSTAAARWPRMPFSRLVPRIPRRRGGAHGRRRLPGRSRHPGGGRGRGLARHAPQRRRRRLSRRSVTPSQRDAASHGGALAQLEALARYRFAPRAAVRHQTANRRIKGIAVSQSSFPSSTHQASIECNSCQCDWGGARERSVRRLSWRRRRPPHAAPAAGTS